MRRRRGSARGGGSARARSRTCSSSTRAGRPRIARAAGSDGPITVLTFRSSGAELDQLRHRGRPFFAPPWRADEVGVVLDAGVEWEEIQQLVTESYCALAPKRLRDLVARPADGAG